MILASSRAVAVVLAATGLPAVLPRAADPPRLDASLGAVSGRGVRPIRARLILAVTPGWHIAAEQPGTIGLATRVAWQLPPGWRVVAVRWPPPKRSVEGRDTLYTYEGRTAVEVHFDAPAAIGPGPIRATIAYGLCRDICIPGRESVTLVP